jgi:hypothetical protein
MVFVTNNFTYDVSLYFDNGDGSYLLTLAHGDGGPDGMDGAWEV